MALAFDAATGTTGGSTTSVTFSHTCTGSNLALFVGAGTSPSTATVSATYNGVDMGATRWTVTEGTVSTRSSGLLLVNPDTGAHNVVVTATGTCDIFGAHSQSWTGVDTASPIRGTPNTASESGGNVNASVTEAEAQSGDVLLTHIVYWSGTLTVAGSGGTSRDEREAIAGGNYGSGSSSVDASVSTTAQWTCGANGFWGMGALALKAGGGGGRTTKNTRAFPLGMAIGMNWVGPGDCS